MGDARQVEALRKNSECDRAARHRPASHDLVSLARARAAELGERPAFVFLDDTGTVSGQVGFAALDRRARAIAATLAECLSLGDRVVVALPTNLPYICALLGCLYAGAIAVPAPAPSARSSRIQSIIDDADPRVILTTKRMSTRSDAPLNIDSGNSSRTIVFIEDIDPALADAYEWRRPEPDSLALLQYTSGSTTEPKGVMVTHRNLMANQAMIAAALGHDRSVRYGGWLPLHHDMGLVANVVQPLYLGVVCFLMSPIGVFQRPFRWLKAISDWRLTTSGGPNFIYDLCVRRVRPEEKASLDLSSWRVALNGAEPVRDDTMARFAQAFAPCGFRSEAFAPCYGLAEATLFVSGGVRNSRSRIEVDRRALECEGRIVNRHGGRPIVSCGRPASVSDVRIVDAVTLVECEPKMIGEVWVAGDHVARGYWRQRQATQDVFGGSLPNGQPSYLRTGDLGFMLGGELYITGRIKDTIIIRGRKYYPQDIEKAIENACPQVQTNASAGFAMDIDDEERLVVVAELDRDAEAMGREVAQTIRRIVSAELDVATTGIVLIRAGRLPKTSSGKVRRAACRRELLQQRLNPLFQSWIGLSYSKQVSATGMSVIVSDVIAPAGDGHAEAARVYREETAE